MTPPTEAALFLADRVAAEHGETEYVRRLRAGTLNDTLPVKAIEWRDAHWLAQVAPAPEEVDL